MHFQQGAHDSKDKSPQWISIGRGVPTTHFECSAVASGQHYCILGVSGIPHSCLCVLPAAEDTAVAVLLLLLPLRSHIHAHKARIGIVVTGHVPGQNRWLGS
eukprot:scaffold142250_cov18-Tisochrysis_lutea.AAC.2